MTIKIKNDLEKLPTGPGVYFFKNKTGDFLYIGKATNLRSRVRSYFNGREVNRPVEFAIPKIAKVDWEKTDSVLEAVILEANLIRKHLPPYNVFLKDDKSFAYAVVTKDEFSQIVILRRTDFENLEDPIKGCAVNCGKLRILNKKYKDIKISRVFGPYFSKLQLETALKIIRKIIPYHSLRQKTEKGCLDFQIGTCPGPFVGAISKEDYRKNIKNIILILEGKKKNLIKSLEKEMKEYSKNHEFEKAADARNQIFALKHIRDVALISKENGIGIFGKTKPHPIRVEAYDVSDISGQHSVGSMVVFKDNEPNKAEYRKFKIKTVLEADDVGMMREILMRRFNNSWPRPNLILLDGGQGHLNMAQKVLKIFDLNIPVIAVAKGPARKNLELRYDANLRINANPRIANILNNQKLIRYIISEAHRFAISYHKKVRRRNFI